MHFKQQNSTHLNIYHLQDIKQFTYYYWNCIPALLYPSKIQLVETLKKQEIDKKGLFELAVQFFREKKFIAFFILNQNKFISLEDVDNIVTNKDLIFVFLNPSNILNQPGWPLRNLLAGLAYLK